MNHEGAVSGKLLIYWLVTIILPCLVLLLPVNEIMTADLKVFLSITLVAILFFIFEQVNGTVVTILLPIAYVLILGVPAEVAYKPWSMSILWMLIGGFLLANLMEKVGLLRRIAYKCILLTGASYKGIIWGIALAGAIIFLLIPNDNAAVPIAALAYGICLSLDLKKGPEAAGIMLAAAAAAVLPSCFLFNTTVFLFFGLGEAATGPMTVGWFEYLYRCFPLAVYYVALFWVIVRMFGRNVQLNGREYFQAEYEAMGRLSADEKRVLVDILLLMTFIFTQSIHKIDVLWGFAVIPFLMYLPGLKVADETDLENVELEHDILCRRMSFHRYCGRSHRHRGTCRQDCGAAYGGKEPCSDPVHGLCCLFHPEFRHDAHGDQCHIRVASGSDCAGYSSESACPLHPDE